jgi:hypothetical protein
MTLRALTLWQPWAWAISSGHKPLENRTWAPGASMLGEWLAITAGKKRPLGESMLELARVVPEVAQANLHLGAVVAVARLAGCFRVDDYGTVLEHAWGPRGSLAGWGRDNPRWSIWASGPWCWAFDEVVTLRAPVACLGARKVWELPPDVLAEVRKGFAAAKAADAR